MTTHTVVPLTPADQHAVNAIIGECINAVLRVLASRRKLVRVDDLRESAYFQSIAIGGLYHRTAELYPPEVRAEIDRHALTLAGLMARGET